MMCADMGGADGFGPVWPSLDERGVPPRRWGGEPSPLRLAMGMPGGWNLRYFALRPRGSSKRRLSRMSYCQSGSRSWSG